MYLAKTRWAFCFVFILGCAILGATDDPRKQLDETKAYLQQLGVKTDLKEFNFSTTPDEQAREEIITATEPGHITPATPARIVNLLPIMSSNSAVALVKAGLPLDELRQNGFTLESTAEAWEALREEFKDGSTLDKVCAALLAGPIRFNLIAQHGDGMLLRHVPKLRTLAQKLGVNAVLNLHDANRELAWTNLLAATRIATAWQTEPAEVSHLVRFHCVKIAFDSAWQCLHGTNWSEAELAALQREWESADFFRGLPDTIAFERASVAALCEAERQLPFEKNIPAEELRGTSDEIAAQISEYNRRLRYRDVDSYEDERAMLIFYTDREAQVRQAIRAPDWLHMRQLPGVTNAPLFESKYGSSVIARIRTRQMAIQMQAGPEGFLGRAAEAESLRRIVVTAITLERHRLKHGAYPAKLESLSRDEGHSASVDFMDGKNLRYRLIDDNVLLYSVGLDCNDNGGNIVPRSYPWENVLPDGRSRSDPRSDLVWPLPASLAVIENQQNQREQARLKKIAEEEKAEASQRRKRMARMEKRYRQQKPGQIKERNFLGQSLSKMLHNVNSSFGTNLMSLEQMLTMHPITNKDYPQVLTFEFPINYDVLHKFGNLYLFVDGEETEAQECERTANGNCRLDWNTAFDSSGTHYVQSGLLCTDMKTHESVDVKGPLIRFVSTNLVQFSPYAPRVTDDGVSLYATVVESNAVYRIDVKSPTGEHLTTIQGKTTNGIIDVQWNLMDDKGKKFTGDSIDTIFKVTLPDSGRSQTVER